MDPLSAIGLASNILQFIEFGTNLCGKIYEVAGSITGLTDENAHLSETVDDLKKVTDGLSTSLEGNNKHEVELAKLAAQCRDLSEEMMGIISKLKLKKGDRMWRSVRAAWKSTLKERKIASIERRLAEHRAQIVLRLNIMLYDEQSPIKEHLKRIEQQAINLGNQHGTELKTQRHQLKDIIQRLDTFRIDNADPPSSAVCLNAIQDMRASLSLLISRANEIPRENDILRALYFPSMFRRDDAIGPAVGDTCRWFVGEDDQSDQSTDEESTDEESDHDSDHTNSTHSHAENTPKAVSQRITGLEEHEIDNQGLQASPSIAIGEQGENNDDDTQSLDSDLEGILEEERSSRKDAASRFLHFLLHDHSVFFIYGKAGSGKSTLIKYLADSGNVAVRQRLDEWAEGRRLIFISAFFWSAGDQLQRSLEGLYRSVLFQALSQCPELTTNLFEGAPGFSGWQEVRLSLLKKIMVKLIQILDPKRYTLCLFIDGLDEYEGDSLDQTELVRSIQDWGRSENVKIVCSARPHEEYMQLFTNQQRSMPLHDYTKGDILEYAITSFRGSSASSHCQEVSSVFALAQEIVTLADGVFLWAYLTVRSLSQKMHIYPMEKLQEMLRATPRSLDNFFDQMLDKVDRLTWARTEKFMRPFIYRTN
ncbi:uncharacterized protein DSM5745_07284 [Aspergillus mulundensis]|uniref:Nephrocystin 3-like N-terminal domain-containing protein n=1 Tax=Aspergillus mulundensis TaxID=1810919 RepID=A0A3D8RKM7_9EURO|nr:hypothetical protein DSM5745_07284 [Aspergillus mulundensis]RDW74622.1 hypothetical protein DSM5745_07284 [Aspergillus mulundensis]